MRCLLAVFVAASLSACAGSPPPETPASETPASETPASETPPAGASRPALTAEQCEAQGGTVVGDIGDGATQRPDYVCPSGGAPKGNIAAPKSGPIAVEGSVCCPK